MRQGDAKKSAGPVGRDGRGSPTSRVVVVGGGFGGLQCVRALRRVDVDVLLIDRRNFHLFQPLLYQVATATLSPADVAATLRRVLRKQRNVRVRLAELLAVDLEKRSLSLSDGRVEYDYLILATGLSTDYFGHEDWARHSIGLKSLEDALKIRRQFLEALEHAEWEQDPERRRHLLTAVVIGGGPTGVELAGALGEVVREILPTEFDSGCCCEARIVLIEAGPTILPSFPSDLRERARDQLRLRGVEIVEGSPVTDIEPQSVRLSGTTIRAATVVWAAGLRGSLPSGLPASSVSRGGRVEVGPDCALVGHPEVFLVGDLALVPGVPATAPAALQMGRFVGRAIRADLKAQERPSFRFSDRGLLATIGSGSAVASIGQRGFWGWPAWWLWVFVHIAYLIGFRDRLAVLLQWAWCWLSRSRSARIVATGLPANDPIANGLARSNDG